MNAAERTMPTITARYDPLRKAWMVALPGGLEMPARDEDAVKDIVRRFAYGAAVRFVRVAPPESEAELRAAWGDR